MICDKKITKINNGYHGTFKLKRILSIFYEKEK